MKTIPLTQGYEAIVDDVDYARVVSIKWHVRKSPTTQVCYAANNSGRGGQSKDIYMHRFIIGAHKDQTVDHKDRNGLNNTRSNLRVSKGRLVNSLNAKLSCSNTSGFRGASWHCGMKKWRARIKLNGKEKIIGWFDSAKEAGRAFQDFANRLIADA